MKGHVAGGSMHGRRVTVGFNDNGEGARAVG